MSGFEVYPAIDVRAGRVVRLLQGDYARETRYAPSPLALAARYAEEGARWLHLVDLEAAREGGYALLGLVGRIRRSTPLRVQTGGGVRSDADVQRLLDAGADRVVVGSLAVRDPGTVVGWLDRFGPERLAVALDTRWADADWRLPTAGWTQASDARLDELVDRYAQAGLRHLLCTDIGRDGTLAGPSLDLYRGLSARAPAVRLQASGGIRDAADIAAARAAGCAGAVLGKALLESRVSLGEALGEGAAC